MKKIVLLFILIIVFKTIKGQIVYPEKAKIIAVANVFKDSVSLRWTPSTYELWKLGNSTGYVVNRYLLNNRSNDSIVQYAKKSFTVHLADSLSWEKKIEDSCYFYYASLLYGENVFLEFDNTNLLANQEASLQKENQFYFGLSMLDRSLALARMAGMYYVDTNQVDEGSVLFEIYLNDSTLNLKYDTAYVLVNPNEITTYPKVQIDKVYLEKGYNVVEWTDVYGADNFVSYILQKSYDNGKSFIDIDLTGHVSLRNDKSNKLYFDSVYHQNSTCYRLLGKTIFGEFSQAGAWYCVRNNLNKKNDLSPPVINTIKSIGKSIYLNWEVLDSIKKEIDYFEVYRAGIAEKDKFYKIGNTKELEYIDKKPLEVAYYKVHLYDKNGNVSQSFSVMYCLQDSIAPVPPHNLNYEVDSLGVVTIFWSNNEEKDIYGYKVFRANFPEEEFVTVSNRIQSDTVFKDTLSLAYLTSSCYYKLIAYDRHYNSSNFSDIIKVILPDTISPVAPQIVLVEEKDNQVLVKIIPSFSKDVKKYYLLEWKILDSSWIIKDALTYFNQPLIRTFDKQSNEQKLVLVAYDSSGNHSPLSNHLIVSPKQEQFDIKIHPIVDYQKKQIDFHLDAFINASYFLYKEDTIGKMRLFKQSTSSHFSDKKVLLNSHYRYQVKVVLDDGLVFYSDVVEVDF